MELSLGANHVSASFRIEHPSAVGEARRYAVALAQSLLLDQTEVGRVALVVTEAGTNILQHAHHGEILLRALHHGQHGMVEVLALDRGPGMGNVALCMRDGVSTGGSSGLGLGAIERLSVSLEIYSLPDQGTALLARVGRPPAATPEPHALAWGVTCVQMNGELVCGDAWAVAPGRYTDTLVVFDGLGHGAEAFGAATEALRTFWDHVAEAPEAIITQLHEQLSSTRGGVGAVARIDRLRHVITYVGVGNISGHLSTASGESRGMLSFGGVLGAKITRLKSFEHSFEADGLFILHSDGLSSRWSLDPYPGLRGRDPSLIAGILYRDFANRRDDVVVLVCRIPASLEPREGP